MHVKVQTSRNTWTAFDYQSLLNAIAFICV